MKIARMGHPVLFRTAEPVADPRDPDIARLAADMEETMADAQGIGLAAPQVHHPVRMVLFRVPESRAGEDEHGEADEAVPMTVMLNPEIEPIGEDTSVDWEACLSLPGMIGAVPRFTHIRYRWTTLQGDVLERPAQGFHARAVQHECDHLDGILYPMRMTDLSLFGYAEEMRERGQIPAEDVDCLAEDGEAAE